MIEANTEVPWDARPSPTLYGGWLKDLVGRVGAVHTKPLHIIVEGHRTSVRRWVSSFSRPNRKADRTSAFPAQGARLIQGATLP